MLIARLVLAVDVHQHQRRQQPTKHGWVLYIAYGYPSLPEEELSRCPPMDFLAFSSMALERTSRALPVPIL